MSITVLPLANRFIRQYAEFPDVDMQFASKAAFETALVGPRFPDGWIAYCVAERKWYYADKVLSVAVAFRIVAFADLTGNPSDNALLAAALNAKAPLASPTFTGTVNGITKSMVGLANIDNTSDANKPVSTAQQTALDLKVDKITGKGLSTEDYTTTEKTKLSGIATAATANTKATNLEQQTGTDDVKFLTPLSNAGWWTWIKTQIQDISAIWTFSNITESTSTTTGGAKFSGGIGVAKRIWANALSLSSLVGTGDRVLQTDSTGAVTSPLGIQPMRISDADAINNILTAGNWSSGVYTGPALTGCFEGQMLRNSLYFYKMYTDTEVIRVARV